MGKEKGKVKYYLRGIGIGLLIAAILYSTVIIPQYKMTEEDIIEKAKELGMVMKEEDDIDLSALTGTPSPTRGADLASNEGADLTPAGGENLTPAPTEGAEANPPAQPDAPNMPGEPSGIPSSTGTGPTDGDGMKEPTGPSDGSGMTEPSVPDTSITTVPEVTGSIEPETPPATGTVSQPSPTAVPPDKNGKISITIVKGMNSDDFALLAQQVGLVKDAKDFDNYLMANGYAKELRAGTYLISADATYEEIAKRVTPQ